MADPTSASDPVPLLLVDDEEAITDSLGPFLTRSGFDVTIAHDGVEALAAVARHQPAIIVCDVLMPELDGRAVVRRLREGGNWVPVVLLTKVGESFERSAALEEGADDYLNKPFDPSELVARVRAVLRRSTPGVPPLAASPALTSGSLRWDRAARRAFVDGKEVQLTPKAGLLLDYLMTHPRELHTRDRLLSAVWGFDFPVSTRAVDHRVAELRRVLGDDPSEPTWIETVQASGYRFRGAVQAG